MAVGMRIAGWALVRHAHLASPSLQRLDFAANRPLNTLLTKVTPLGGLRYGHDPRNLSRYGRSSCGRSALQSRGSVRFRSIAEIGWAPTDLNPDPRPPCAEKRLQLALVAPHALGFFARMCSSCPYDLAYDPAASGLRRRKNFVAATAGPITNCLRDIRGIGEPTRLMR